MAQYDINLREYWRILKKRKLIVFITAFLLGVFSTFFAVMNAPTPLYSSVCSIKFERETTLEGLYARTLSWSDADDIETQLTIVTGYSVLLETAKNLGLVPRERSIDDPQTIAIVDGLKSRVAVERENYTNIIHIRITDASPSFAQRMANELARTYRDLHAEQQGKRTREALRYIEEQLLDVRRKLKRAEEEFNRFSQVNQLISIDMQSENLLVQKKQIADELRKLNEDESELKILSERISQYLKDPASVSEPNFYSTRASAQYQATNNSLVELFLKKQSLLENLTEQHPDVLAIYLRITENSKKMLMLLQLQMDSIEQRRVGLNAELEDVNFKTNNLMEKKLEYDRLKREVDSFRSTTVLLETKNQEALIRKAEKPEEVVIVKPALQSTVPINPPKTFATGLMGIVIGIVLGLIMAFIIETFDTSIGAIEDVEETIGARVLGVIPHTDTKEILSSLKDSYTRELDEASTKKIVNLAAHFAPKSMFSESFRALRTNIQFTETSENIQTLMITSTSPQEGKTLISTNLAISLAQAGIKTLLIGADLRKPGIGRMFGLDENPGLTDIIMGSYPWQDTVKTVTDLIMGRMTMDDVMLTPGLDNLNIITSGPIPPNPAELIESKHLVSFIDEAKKEYDLIIFDTTPVLSATDAAILGTKMDSVLIVYRVGSVSKGLLKRTSSQLKQVGCNITGVILNGMKPDISPDFPSYKYYQYFSYYSDEKHQKKVSGKRKIFSLPWKRGDKGNPGDNRTQKSEYAHVEEREDKKRALKILLIAFAGLMLSGVILWQSGIFKTPVSFVTKEIDAVAEPAGPPEKTESFGQTPVEPLKPEEGRLEANPADILREVVPEKGLENNVLPGEENDNVLSDKDETPEVTAIEEAAVISPSYTEGSFPYSVFYGSFKTRERADKAVTELSATADGGYPVKVDLGETGIWYRIYCGYFKNQKDAEGFILKHDLTGAMVKKTLFANLIKEEYSSDRNTLMSEMMIKGFSPYEIRDERGNSFLLAGAFLTKEGAVSQNEELMAEGFNSLVIRR